MKFTHSASNWMITRLKQKEICLLQHLELLFDIVIGNIALRCTPFVFVILLLKVNIFC